MIFNKDSQGTTLTSAASCPVGQVRLNFHLHHSKFYLPMKNCIFHNVSFKSKQNMVLACESIFSRTSLDARPQNLHMFSKVNPKYIQRSCPVGQARYSFHLPFSYNLQFLLARGNGASTGHDIIFCSDLPRRASDIQFSLALLQLSIYAYQNLKAI